MLHTYYVTFTALHLQEGETPLHLAAESGSAARVNLLLTHGALVNAPDSKRRTALHVALQHGHVDAVRALLAHGARLDASDDDGVTPLALAARSGDTVLAALVGGAQVPVACPLKCGASLLQRLLDFHLQHDCPRRRLKCEACNTECTASLLEEHEEDVCPFTMVICPYHCGATVPRYLLGFHCERQCGNRPAAPELSAAVVADWGGREWWQWSGRTLSAALQAYIPPDERTHEEVDGSSEWRVYAGDQEFGTHGAALFVSSSYCRELLDARGLTGRDLLCVAAAGYRLQPRWQAMLEELAPEKWSPALKEALHSAWERDRTGGAAATESKGETEGEGAPAAAPAPAPAPARPVSEWEDEVRTRLAASPLAKATPADVARIQVEHALHMVGYGPEARAELSAAWLRVLEPELRRAHTPAPVPLPPAAVSVPASLAPELLMQCMPLAVVTNFGDGPLSYVPLPPLADLTNPAALETLSSKLPPGATEADRWTAAGVQLITPKLTELAGVDEMVQAPPYAATFRCVGQIAVPPSASSASSASAASAAATSSGVASTCALADLRPIITQALGIIAATETTLAPVTVITKPKANTKQPVPRPIPTGYLLPHGAPNPPSRRVLSAHFDFVNLNTGRTVLREVEAGTSPLELSPILLVKVHEVVLEA